MTLHLGTIPAGSTIPIPFATYGSSGQSITLTGLAVTDVEIFKNGSVIQRASDAGIALLDTDGVDFDGITGVHGFSINLADDSDAGFYAVGSFYWVVVSAITVDAQTVNFIAATFRIGPAEAIAGHAKVDVGGWKGATAPDMTGDAYARLGAPAGASTAADVAAVKAETALIKAKTDNLPADPSRQSLLDVSIAAISSTLGTPAGASIAADIAAISSGSAPTAAEIADAVHDEAVDGVFTLRQLQRLMAAVLLGKVSGAGISPTVTFRAVDDAKTRVTAVTDPNGNRTSITLDASA